MSTNANVFKSLSVQGRAATGGAPTYDRGNSRPGPPYSTSSPSSRPASSAHSPHNPVQERRSIPMRPSTTSTRASHAPGSQAPPSATLLARLADKKKEIEAVEALQHASDLFLRRLEGLADDCEAMADAGIGACMYPRAWSALGRTTHGLFLLLFPSVRPSFL